MSARGVGNIHFINGIMNKYLYNIKNTKSIKMGMPNVYMFQQDNNSTDTLLSLTGNG